MELNPKQREAVEHFEGPLLVLAGAGSGKTRVVTERILHLLSVGISPSAIVAVTFTNKAANEMQQRINAQAMAHVLTCTFHSFATQILRQSIEHLGFTREFIIYDDEDSTQLLRQCLQQLGLPSERSEVRNFAKRISYAKNHLSIADRESKAVHDLYQKRLEECGALDFDDLLAKGVELFRRREKVLREYQRRYRFVLIDEYQDTNPAQYLLIKLLVAEHRNIFAVGDPDQSIYSWRGAHIENILNFERDYPGAKIVFLEENYRSTSHILQGANALVSHNCARYEKKLWTDRGEGEKIGIKIVRREQEEAQFVLEKIEKHHKQGISLDNCVIFYRTHAQSRSFEDACLQRDLPYKVIGGLSFYQRKEVKDFIAYLRLVQGNNDWISFLRTVNLPKRGIGPVLIERIRSYAEQHNLPIVEACSQIGDESSFSTLQREKIGDYARRIKEVRQLLGEGIPLPIVLRQGIERLGYLQVLQQDKEKYEERLANILELVNKTSEGYVSLVDFLADMSLRLDKEELETEGIRLMTVHNGKGLEFELVFIVGLEEGLFPHENARYDEDKLEEERRLCYVGMTRARRFLYLSAAQNRSLWGTQRKMRISRFLREIPATHSYQCNKGEILFRLGERVSHTTLGEGIIQKVNHTPFGLTYEVFFPGQEQVYSLAAQYVQKALTHL